MIQIQVRGEEELSLQVRIEESGSFAYPFLGQIQAVGSTAKEIENTISNGLSGDYLIAPDVLVYVVEYRPFFIRGEVTKPGSYPFVPGLTVQKAISIAGGFTDYASKNRIYIQRENVMQDNRQKAGLDTVIFPGDTVTIEEGFF